jgi:hypothetical protein
MAAPVRKVIVDFDKSKAAKFVANGATGVFTQRVYFSNFFAAAVTGDLDLTGFPGGLIIVGAWFLLRTPFAGGAIATATISAGTTGSPALYVAAQDCFTTQAATPTAPIGIVGAAQVPGTFLGTTATPLAASTIRIRLTTTVGNTNVATQGCADFYCALRAIYYRAA